MASWQETFGERSGERPFSELVGKTLTRVSRAHISSNRIEFACSDGTVYVMFHREDCCEHVAVEDITGDIEDLIGLPILKAEETSNSDGERPEDSDESWTWTFYTLRTERGAVVLRWLGSSNGYYSERVSFERFEVDHG
jgi:hypothetical protein